MTWKPCRVAADLLAAHPWRSPPHPKAAHWDLVTVEVFWVQWTRYFPHATIIVNCWHKEGWLHAFMLFTTSTTHRTRRCWPLSLLSWNWVVTGVSCSYSKRVWCGSSVCSPPVSRVVHSEMLVCIAWLVLCLSAWSSLVCSDTNKAFSPEKFSLLQSVLWKPWRWSFWKISD